MPRRALLNCRQAFTKNLHRIVTHGSGFVASCRPDATGERYVRLMPYHYNNWADIA
jgi:hypothetical protein